MKGEIDLTGYQKVTSKKCVLLKKSVPWTDEKIKLLDEDLNLFCSLDFENDVFDKLIESPYLKRDSGDLKYFYFDTENKTTLNSSERKAHISNLIKLLDSRKPETTTKLKNSCKNCNYPTLSILKESEKNNNDIKLHICRKCGYVVAL